jgi:hypothetical protein
VETSLLAALEEQSDVEVRTFLLNQLNLVGSDKSVNVIKKYLENEDFTEPVAQTLVAIGSESAAVALFENFPKVIRRRENYPHKSFGRTQIRTGTAGNYRFLQIRKFKLA